MKITTRPRVLMLGWEYPPRFAGGLGKACQGLSQALARQGAQVFFVLPTFPEKLSEPYLEVVGAQEVLIEAGWEPVPPGVSASPERGFVSTLRADARLFPYGAAPEGPVSERILESLQVEPAIEHAAPRRSLTSTRQKITRVSQKKPEPQKAEIYGKNLWSEIERFAFTVSHLADTHEVDCVHAHDWMTFPAAFEFQRVTGVPVFAHVHATEYDRSGENLNNDVFRIEREGFRKATHIFAVSRYTAGILERLYGVDGRKISVVYNAPDTDVTSFIASPDTPREPQVIFLGRLTFQKGPDHFLRAAALVAEADAKARFVLCGTGDMMDQLKRMAHRLGIEERVDFTGFVNPVEVDQILAHSKVLVMPSISEPFGLVALEAIRCGIPIIISKQSGVREVLHRALQVDFWDHEKLADQMLAALRLPDLSKQLVHEGMEQVRLLSWDKSAIRVIDSYYEHLGSFYSQAVGGAHGH